MTTQCYTQCLLNNPRNHSDIQYSSIILNFGIPSMEDYLYFNFKIHLYVKT